MDGRVGGVCMYVCMYEQKIEIDEEEMNRFIQLAKALDVLKKARAKVNDDDDDDDGMQEEDDDDDMGEDNDEDDERDKKVKATKR